MATLPTPPAPIAFPRAVPPMPAVARILSRFDRPQLEGFIAVAIDLLDLIDGDPDAEDNGDREASNGDDRDVAWLEWSGLAHRQRAAPASAGDGDCEDHEDDDQAGVRDEDGVNTITPDEENAQLRAEFYQRIGLPMPAELPLGAGCPIADPGENQWRAVPQYGVDQSKGPA